MRAITVLAFVVTFVACAPPKPVNVVTGEACWRCRQPIKNARLAGELLQSNGLALKFRTIHCMTTWIGQQNATPEGTFYVTDYSTGKWVRASSASFVRTIVDRNTMARDFLAFGDAETAAATARDDQATVVKWDNVLATGRAEPLGGN
jgi:hypothetical protein